MSLGEEKRGKSRMFPPSVVVYFLFPLSFVCLFLFCRQKRKEKTGVCGEEEDIVGKEKSIEEKGKEKKGKMVNVVNDCDV